MDDVPGQLLEQAIACLKPGNAEGAEPYLRRKLAGMDRFHGTMHTGSLICANNLAVALMCRRAYAEALPFAQRAVEGLRSTLGIGHEFTKVAERDLAEIQQEPDEGTGQWRRRR